MKVVGIAHIGIGITQSRNNHIRLRDARGPGTVSATDVSHQLHLLQSCQCHYYNDIHVEDLLPPSGGAIGSLKGLSRQVPADA